MWLKHLIRVGVAHHVDDGSEADAGWGRPVASYRKNLRFFVEKGNIDPFSVVSAPIFAIEHVFLCIFRDLQNHVFEFQKINTPGGVWRSRSATAACEGSARVEGLRGVRGAPWLGRKGEGKPGATEKCDVRTSRTAGCTVDRSRHANKVG